MSMWMNLRIAGRIGVGGCYSRATPRRDVFLRNAEQTRHRGQTPHARACRLDNGGRHGCKRKDTHRQWNRAPVGRARADRVDGVGVGGAGVQVPRRARPHRVPGSRVRGDAAAVADRTAARTAAAGVRASGASARRRRRHPACAQRARAAARESARARSHVVGMSRRGWRRLLPPRVVPEIDSGRSIACWIAQGRCETGRGVGDAVAARGGVPATGACGFDRPQRP